MLVRVVSAVSVVRVVSAVVSFIPLRINRQQEKKNKEKKKGT